MSSSPSPETVEQTKRQIRSLVNEVSELSKSDMQAGEYYPAVLHRIISALAAVGGAIWLFDTENNLKLSYQIQVSENLLNSEDEDAQRHVRLLSRVLSAGRPELVPPLSSFGEDHDQANPTRFLLVVCPIINNKQSTGLIEVFQRPDSPPDTQRGYLRFLEHMSKLIGDWQKGHTLQQVAVRQELWQQSDQFARLVHENLDLRDTAFTIANEGRRLIECDRVSVAMLRGTKAKVISISGQDSIENRSNIVTSLNNLATRVIRSGEPLWYDGTTEDLPPQIEDAIEEYVDLSHGRTVAILPIHRPERPIAGDVMAKRSTTTEVRRKQDIIGALIVEQIETQIARPLLEGRVDLVYEHACRALSNSMDHSQLFLMPLWRFLGRLSWLFRGSTLPKTMTILGLVAAALVAIFIVPIDFDLEGNGKLQPTVQRKIFANVDGYVEDVLVKHGDPVKAGQLLVRLKNPQYLQELLSVQGQLKEAESGWDYVKQSRNSGFGTFTEAQRLDLSLKVGEYEQKVKNYTAESLVLMERIEQLERFSPIDGVITTWEVEQILQARPVVTGQELMNVADITSPWDVEIYMPEKRMMYLDEAMKTNAIDGYLPVEFILMTDPATTHKGRLHVDQIHQRAEMDPEEGAYVKLRVVPDSMKGLVLRPGSKVIADVKCGKRSIAFVWFHEVVEWVRANVIF